jgi:plasmid stabilization system protein ParE
MRVRYTPRAFADREAIYYRVGEDEVSIIHIRHAARRAWEGGN